MALISHGRTFTGKSNGIMGCRTPDFPPGKNDELTPDFRCWAIKLP